MIAGPLLTAGIFTFLFTRVAHLSSQGVPYFAYAFAGTLGFNCFSSTVARSSDSLVRNNQLVAKVYFYRLVLPISTAFATLVDLAAGSAVLALIIAIEGPRVSPAVITSPLWMLGLAAVGLGAGTLAGAATVRYRDLVVIVPVVLQLLLFISPVAYSSTAVPGSARPIYDLNPLVGLLEGLKWSLYGTTVDWWHALYAGAVTVLLIVLALYLFRRMEQSFADVI